MHETLRKKSNNDKYVICMIVMGLIARKTCLRCLLITKAQTIYPHILITTPMLLAYGKVLYQYATSEISFF